MRTLRTLRTPRLLLLAILVTIAVVAAACGDDDDADTTPAETPVSGDADSADADNGEFAGDSPPGASVAPIDVEVRDSGATVASYVYDDVTVHTYTNPESGFANTTAVIETESSLVLVDSHFAEAAAEDFRAYAETFDKPFERLFITHAHSDHIGGIPVFGEIPSTSSAAVIEQAAEEGATITDGLEPGTLEIDGVTFEISFYEDAEAPDQIVILLPDSGVMFIGDLIYSEFHAVMSTSWDNWLSILDELEATPGLSLIVPGHGTVGAPEALFADMNDYLTTAQGVWDQVDEPDAFVAGMVEAYPDRPGTGLLDFGAGRLFPKP